MDNSLSKRIKFRHMQCFLAVLQLGTIQRAADSLSLTQPAVSKTIAELEEIVGAQLFERGRTGAAVTRHGQLFAPHARACIDALRLGVDELQRYDARQPLVLSIGALPTAAAPLLAPALAMFRSVWPGASVRVFTHANQRLLQGLQTGELALAVGRLSDSEHMAGLSFEHLVREPLAIAVRAGHPLLDETSAAAAQLAPFPIVVPPAGTLIRRLADNMLTAFGARTSTALVETMSVSLGRELTLHHDAVWFVPVGAIEHDLTVRLLVQLPVPHAGTEEPIGLLRRIPETLAPAELALADAIRDVARKRSALQAGVRP
jgi:LysR family transcriptional regulator, pca operon transcriptional activator